MLRYVGRTLRFTRHLAVCLLLQAAVLFALSPQAFSAPKRSIVMRSKADGSSVRLTMIVARDKPGDASLVELQRNDGSGFRSIAHLAKPGKRETFVDSTVTFGEFSYRARLIKNRHAGGWSRVVSVLLKHPAEPPQPNPVPTLPPTNDSNCDYLPLPAGVSECEAGFEDAVSLIVNQERAAGGLPALAVHPQLNCAAREHTLKMIIEGDFSHDGWYDSIQRSGYQGNSAGQNIALGFSAPALVMEGWMSSPGHRQNIMSQRFLHIGVSCLVGRGYKWWTQDFGG